MSKLLFFYYPYTFFPCSFPYSQQPWYLQPLLCLFVCFVYKKSYYFLLNSLSFYNVTFSLDNQSQLSYLVCCVVVLQEEFIVLGLFLYYLQICMWIHVFLPPQSQLDSGLFWMQNGSLHSTRSLASLDLTKCTGVYPIIALHLSVLKYSCLCAP